MQLSGSQYKELFLALIDAFANTTSLERMLLFELDKNLMVVAGGGSLQDIAFKLIQVANSQGWVEDLIRAARDDNPGNPALKAIAQVLLDDLSSARNVDYTKLRDLLKAQQWEEADVETFDIMFKVADREEDGWLDNKCIENFPCTDLRTIDQLWVKYSDERFGFSVQKRIWNEQASQNYSMFIEIVGWLEDSSKCGYFPVRLVSLAFGTRGYREKGGIVVSSLASRLVKCNI